MSLEDALAAFRHGREPTPPRRPCADSEVVPLTVQDGLNFFCEAPIRCDVETVEGPPLDIYNYPDRKYLWVVRCDDVPFAQECPKELPLRKHSNLTGGGAAFGGGEVWFANPDQIYLNGGSGRYPVETDEDLLEAVTVFFLRIGYDVAVPPYDEDNDRRPRAFKSARQVVWRKMEIDHAAA